MIPPFVLPTGTGPHRELVGHVCPLDGHRTVLPVGITLIFSAVMLASLGVPS